MLEPLKNVQVWRFSIYYFFVFGAFVALRCGCRAT
jgi:NNP family nitrate/nitrite transporter-like MFS transporter